MSPTNCTLVQRPIRAAVRLSVTLRVRFRVGFRFGVGVRLRFRDRVTVRGGQTKAKFVT